MLPCRVVKGEGLRVGGVSYKNKPTGVEVVAGALGGCLSLARERLDRGHRYEQKKNDE
jgi:hypothetical protein